MHRTCYSRHLRRCVIIFPHGERISHRLFLAKPALCSLLRSGSIYHFAVGDLGEILLAVGYLGDKLDQWYPV